MKQDIIELPARVVDAIGSIRDSKDLYEFYDNALGRSAKLILHTHAILGMSPGEAVDTLQAIDGVRDLLAILSGNPRGLGHEYEDQEEEEEEEEDDEEDDDDQEAGAPEGEG